MRTEQSELRWVPLAECGFTFGVYVDADGNLPALHELDWDWPHSSETEPRRTVHEVPEQVNKAVESNGNLA